VSQDKRWPAGGFDNFGHRKSLTGARYAEQHLMPLALSNALKKLLDG
jgi:hypothetical protein